MDFPEFFLGVYLGDQKKKLVDTSKIDISFECHHLGYPTFNKVIVSFIIHPEKAPLLHIDYLEDDSNDYLLTEYIDCIHAY